MSISDETRTVLKAREILLASRSALDNAPGVRPYILDSWKRSLLHGLDPDACEPLYVPCTETNDQLRQAAAAVVAEKSAALSQSNCSLAITDPNGRLLNRWVADAGFAATLDRKLIVPEYSVAEGATGTGSSSIVLETGRPATVAGPEHFNGDWIGFTCAGAPLRHPITRRLIGSLNLTVPYADTSPVLLSWVSDIASVIERVLLNNATVEEHLLLSAYLAAKRDARHPVLCLNEQTVISNAPAARLLSPVDQAMLWEVASDLLNNPGRDATLALADGSSVCVDATAVSNGTATIGAVVKLKPSAPVERSTMAANGSRVVLPGLVGSSSVWQRLCARATSSKNSPTLVIGEAGSGKMAVASALGGGSPAVVDAVQYDVNVQWLEAVRAACESGATHVVLRHIDCLEAATARSTAAILETARGNGVRVCATMTTQATERPATPLLDWFDDILEVPSLSQRIDDVALLLDTLTARHAMGVHRVRWLPDAVQTITRINWPRNVASLDAAVREVLSTVKKSSISASDLPVDIASRASRRTLVGLEQIEAKAIIKAMRDADGNKKLAADTLGIARSTLYRKVRALGIDLSSSNY